MSKNERLFYERVHRKAGTLTPEMTAAILYAYRVLAERIPETEIARLIAIGAIDSMILAVFSDARLDLAFNRTRQVIRRQVESSFTYVAKDLPKAGKVSGVISVTFDYLNPNVLTAIRELDAKILPTLKADVRETVRQNVRAGLEAGKNPRTIARAIREVVGLSPAQELAVRNYRAELESGKTGAATSRKLHDARYKVTEGMTSAKIDKMTAVYRRNMVAYHAETISRTATLDAFKAGQALSWQDAIDKGIVDAAEAQKTWVTVGDSRVRDEHAAMSGETVPYDAAYSNGEVMPGESTYNCRCLSRFGIAARRAA